MFECWLGEPQQQQQHMTKMEDREESWCKPIEKTNIFQNIQHLIKLPNHFSWKNTFVKNKQIAT